MAKRSTIDAVETVNNVADDAALAAKQAALANIPAPTFREDIEWSATFADKQFNVRFDDAYTYEANKELFASLRTHGQVIKGGDNMSFSLQDDGRLKVISGNLRFAVMGMIRAEVLKERAVAGEPTNESHPLPFEFLKGLVFSGLSYEQELDLMADHTMKKGLNEAELAKEIGEMIYHHGLTDAKAAVKFGMDKNKIARLRMTYSMPTVYAQFVIEKGKAKDKPYHKVGQKQREVLYRAYLDDQNAGHKFREEGRNFRLAWETFLKSPQDATPTSKPKSKDKDIIDGQRKSLAATFGNNPEIGAVADILGWAANEPEKNLNLAIEKLIEIIDGLRAERDSALDKVMSLQSDVTDLKEKLADSEKEREGLAKELENKNKSKARKS